MIYSSDYDILRPKYIHYLCAYSKNSSCAGNRFDITELCSPELKVLRNTCELSQVIAETISKGVELYNIQLNSRFVTLISVLCLL